MKYMQKALKIFIMIANIIVKVCIFAKMCVIIQSKRDRYLTFM